MFSLQVQLVELVDGGAKVYELAQCQRGAVDPDYFSLGVRRAMHEPLEPEDLEVVSALPEEPASLMDHPEAIEAAARVAEAEAAVMRAEDAGSPDELAMRRLDRARAEERAVLVRLQKARTVAHTERAESRVAQVISLRPRLALVEGGEAA